MIKIIKLFTSWNEKILRLMRKDMSSLKTCAVCGDKALGYNFNAITCESCKAFFRRNALSKKQFNCLFNQNCEITVITRRFCQKCRLKKCLNIGMKSENIMSEEDKLVKRRKVEINRVMNKLKNDKSSKINKSNENELREEAAIVNSNGCDSYSQQSSGSCDRLRTLSPSVSPHLYSTVLAKDPEYMTSKEIVDFILCDPEQTSQAISKLMRTPTEALSTLETIIDSQVDALRLISHLINYPGDALKIISKITNCPLSPLTVFTKSMSSPKDVLDIISKVVSSPENVLQFVRNLMNSPENATHIMNKFMNSPAEALSLLNRLLKEGETLTSPQQQKLLHFQTDHQTVAKTVNSITLDADNNKDLTCGQTYIDDPIILKDVHMEQNNFDNTLPLTSDSLPTLKSHNSVASHSNQRVMCGDPPMTTEVDVAAAEFANEYFDIKTFAQNSLSDDSAFNFPDNLNSLESVLTEVIRIEYQAFNDLPSKESTKKENVNSPGNSNNSQIPQNVIVSPLTLNKNGSSIQHDIKPSQNHRRMSTSHNLNEIEIMKLSELKTASEAYLNLPVDDDLTVLMSNDRIKPEESQQDFKLLQVINLTAVAIKRLIKMAKRIAAFRDMCQEDQVALLKGGCTEMMIMRSVLTYDDDRNTWKIPHTKEDMSNIRAEVLKLAKGNGIEVYEEHLKFISTFDEKWRMDENIILIMCAILLFTPTRSRVVHTDVIKLEQNSYYYLLRRYLESVYSGCEAKSAFIKLIEKISDVVRLNKFIIGVYLNVNPSLVEPLLREIFDLKNH
uniref:Nuclear receptor domain-containing protein n=1 Tax=Glossina austeni TaxID=7395 RepID=A0A1A9VES3_GLOAU